MDTGNVIIIVIVLVILAGLIAILINRKKAVSFPSKVRNAYKMGDIDVKATYLNRQLSFTNDVVSYFKRLVLDQKKDTPFVGDGSVLANSIKNFPQNDCSVFIGVYHEEDNTITDYKLLCADSFDEQTKNVLSQGEGGIVALS